MQKTLFFDLYFTLIAPAVIPGRNEWDYLGITQPEWNAFAETEERCALADSGAIETPRSLTEESPAGEICRFRMKIWTS